MTSKKVLIIHTLVFAFFTIASLSSPFIAMRYPTFFSGFFLLGAVALMLLVVGSWHFFGGCPFTVWENRLRERERPGSAYLRSCIERYASEWFAVRLPRWLIQPVLLGLFALPIAVGLLW